MGVVRLMDQQLGGRGPFYPRRSNCTPTTDSGSTPYRYEEGELLNDDRSEAKNDQKRDFKALQQTITHQKMEIVRLLKTVKTLSSENTKLVKKCEALTSVQAENREIRESMDCFKKDYNQKLMMIKKALEEWRRQRNSSVQQSSSSESGKSELEDNIKILEEQIAKLFREAKVKDDRIAKYEKWYQTLKAGAKAKQLDQSRKGSNEASSFSSSNSFVQNTGGSISGPSNSFTNSDYGPGSQEFLRTSSTASHHFSRPPTHPSRRAL